MMYQYDRSFTFKINEDSWTGYLITEEECTELEVTVLGESSGPAAGLVVYETHSLFIAEGSVEKNTIGHELFHINVHYLHLNSADLDVNQFEEVIAVWIENEADKFVKTRNKLLKKFKKLETPEKK